MLKGYEQKIGFGLLAFMKGMEEKKENDDPLFSFHKLIFKIFTFINIQERPLTAVLDFKQFCN